MSYISVTGYQQIVPQSVDLTVKISRTDSTLVYGSTSIGRLDSLMQVLEKTASDQCSEGLDDIRQETNNIINKINGWLGFWLAMLALVGALLPLVSNWRHSKEYEMKFNVMKEDMNQTSLHCQEVTSTATSSIQKAFQQIQNEWSAIQQEHKRTMKDMAMSQSQLAITNLVNSFISAKGNCLIQESFDRDVLRIELLRNLSLSFNEMIEQIFPDNLTGQNKLLIETALIQIHALYKVIQPGLLKAERSVQIETTLHNIEVLIDDITEDRLDVRTLESRVRRINVEMKRTQSLFFANEA